jgi:hypothetical protein
MQHTYTLTHAHIYTHFKIQSKQWFKKQLRAQRVGTVYVVFPPIQVYFKIKKTSGKEILSLIPIFLSPLYSSKNTTKFSHTYQEEGNIKKESFFSDSLALLLPSSFSLT